MPSYSLKAATDADKPWLDSLRRAAYADLFTATWGGWDEEKHLRHFAACWEEGHISLIEIDAAQVGMMQLFESDSAIEVSEVQIAASHQGQGLASEIIRDVINQARITNRKVTLSTGLKNAGAIKLYQKLGFTEVMRDDFKVYMEHSAT